MSDKQAKRVNPTDDDKRLQALVEEARQDMNGTGYSAQDAVLEVYRRHPELAGMHNQGEERLKVIKMLTDEDQKTKKTDKTEESHSLRNLTKGG